MTRRLDILQAAQRLESLPPLSLELVDMVRRPDADLGRIAQAVEHDPGLTANVMRLANAAVFGGTPAGPMSVRTALVRLGLRRTSELVLEAVIGPYARRPLRGYDLRRDDLWRHSAAVAIATRVLGELRGHPESIDAFLAGLLHDLGKVVLADYVDVDWEPIRRRAFDDGLSFEAAEREVLGIDHAEVGAVLLERWGLSGAVIDAVRAHHDPELATGDDLHTVEVVHACVQIVTGCGLGGGADGAHYHTCVPALDELGVDPDLTERVLAETFSRLEDVQTLGGAAA